MRGSILVEKCEKLPWVHARSGVDIAASIRPLNFSGGNVIGTRMIVEPMHCLPRICQNV
jgi:hypothetical protein